MCKNLETLETMTIDEILMDALTSGGGDPDFDAEAFVEFMTKDESVVQEEQQNRVLRGRYSSFTQSADGYVSVKEQ